MRHQFSLGRAAPVPSNKEMPYRAINLRSSPGFCLDITDGVGVDHIAEVDFGGNLAATLRCLRVNGSIMIYATKGDPEPKLPVRELMQKNLTVHAMSLAGVPHPDRRRAQSDIAAWTATPGRILSVAARFPLYETAAAHRAVERGGKVGTVVVEPRR